MNANPSVSIQLSVDPHTHPLSCFLGEGLEVSPSAFICGKKIHSHTRFNRSELETTETELNAIAAAANIGFSRPSAARGMPMTL